MKKPITFVLAIAAMMWLARPALADVIYDNGGPDRQIALTSDFSGDSFNAYREWADDFQLQPSATTITDIHWWGIYFPFETPQTDEFTIRIFEDNGGTPALTPLYEFTNLAGNRADSGMTMASQGQVIYAYSAVITPLALSANTTYWISILNDTTNDTDDSWYWASSAQTGNGSYRSADGAAWTGADYELAFTLTNDNIVPEPASMMLLGIGLAGLGMRRRKRAH